MAKTVKKRSAKAGLPPGALIHIGERHTEKVNITLCEYTEAGFHQRQVNSLEGVRPPAESTKTLWIHIDGLQDIPILQQIGNIFGLHPLILEDILNTEQRPKREDHGDYLYIVLKRFQQAEKEELVPEQISIVFGTNWLISLQEKEGRLFDPVRERIRNEKGRMRKSGVDYLAHALLDAIVDSYFVILDQFGEEIEDVEEALIGQPSPDTLRSIQSLKRGNLFLRKSIWPLREIVGALGRSDSSLIRESSFIYFRDVYDHVVQAIDTIETYRDMLSGMLDIYLSSISNRMNEIMKVLTLIATLFMPLTFLAGMYGMNFKYMPELEWRWGYFVLWGVMIVVAALMVLFFRRKRWL